MAIPVLIIGKSGSGKSASLRNLDPEKTAVINVLGKPMPFRDRLSKYVTDDYGKVIGAIKKTTRPVIVIDDAGYLLTNQFMRGHANAGAGNGVFILYNQIGDNFWQLINFVMTMPGDQRVYVLMHEDKNDLGEVKPKTIGRMVDEKVCLEGMFTIVLRCMMSDGKHVFRTQTDGTDVAKTPMGMFEAMEIDNDLAAVDAAICDYYGIKTEEETK
ncbi:MAG: AAA family ATPase [Oscillospiraceae bacterium]|nr:AAA family ATPase [Oscillospiraceae bacterium]